MHWQSTPYALPLMLAAAVSVALAHLGWRRRPTPGATIFVVLVLATGEWALTYALELSSPYLPTKILLDRFEFLGVVCIPAAWLALVLQFMGREKWLVPRTLALLAIEPLVTLLLVWTNDLHGLIWSDAWLDISGPFIDFDQTPGVGFWVHTAYSYTLLFLGVLLLIQAFIRAPRLYRGQVASLLIGAFIPWLGNALSVLRLTPWPALDLTPFGFTVSGLVIGWGLFRYQLLDIVPVARGAIVDGMSDGVVVLDVRNRVVDLNPAAQRIIRRTASEAVGQPAAEVFSARSDLVEKYRDMTEASAEIVLPGPSRPSQAGQEGGEDQHYFDLRISPLYDRRHNFTGRLIVLRDITQRKQAEEALRTAEAETRLRLREQTALRESGAIISSTLDLATVLNRIAEQMGRAIEVTSAYICDYQPETAVSNALAVYVSPQACAQEQVGDWGLACYLPRNFPGLIESLQASQPRVFHQDDPQLIASERAHLQETGTQTLVVVPLQIREQIIGYAELRESRMRRELTADEIDLCQGIAQQAAIAIENARLYDETRRHASDMGALYTIAHMAGRTLMMEDVLSQSLSAVLLLLDFEGGVIGLVDSRDGQLHLTAEHRLPSVLSRRLRRGGFANTALAYAHDQRRSLILNSADLEAPPALKRMADEMATLGLNTCVCIPLVHQDQSLGVMGLYTRQARFFSPDELTFLDTVGRQIAAAVANAALFQAIAGERSRLKALVESSRDGIMLVGTDLRVLVTNAVALELLHLPGDPADWMDKPVREVLAVLRRHAPVAVQTTLAELRRVQKGDEPAAEGEFEVSPHTIHWLNLPVLAGGSPLGRLLVLHDVTQERTVEMMRDDLTRTLIHDLRNPLTTISTSLQLLEQLGGDFSPDQGFMLEIARSSAQKMLRLINNILDVSQLESGRMPLTYEEVSLADLVADTLRTQLPLAAGKGVRLESDVSPQLPSAWADVKLIERVLQNLVGNAIRFTPTGGLVQIMARQDGEVTGRESSQLLRISVLDSGPGLSPEVKGRLFQKFVTGGGEESGSGLGLAFCKLAVEAHGGHIWAESEPGRMTTFTFTLPVARADDTDEG